MLIEITGSTWRTWLASSRIREKPSRKCPTQSIMGECQTACFHTIIMAKNCQGFSDKDTLYSSVCSLHQVDENRKAVTTEIKKSICNLIMEINRKGKILVNQLEVWSIVDMVWNIYKIHSWKGTEHMIWWWSRLSPRTMSRHSRNSRRMSPPSLNTWIMWSPSPSGQQPSTVALLSSIARDWYEGSMFILPLVSFVCSPWSMDKLDFIFECFALCRFYVKSSTSCGRSAVPHMFPRAQCGSSVAQASGPQMLI